MPSALSGNAEVIPPLVDGSCFVLLAGSWCTYAPLNVAYTAQWACTPVRCAVRTRLDGRKNGEGCKRLLLGTGVEGRLGCRNLQSSRRQCQKAQVIRASQTVRQPSRRNGRWMRGRQTGNSCRCLWLGKLVCPPRQCAPGQRLTTCSLSVRSKTLHACM